MKRYIGFLFVLLALPLFAADVVFTTPNGQITVEMSGNTQGNSVTTGQIVENIGYKLEALETLYSGKLGRTESMKAKKLMDEVFAMLANIPSDQSISVSTSATSSNESSASFSMNVSVTETGTDIDAGSVEAESGNQAMNGVDFDRLLNQIRNESFADDQLNVIRTAAKRNHFTVDQSARVLSVLTYSDDQISALRILYPKVVDPENSHNILSVFTYGDDKEEAQNIMNQ